MDVFANDDDEQEHIKRAMNLQDDEQEQQQEEEESDFEDERELLCRPEMGPNGDDEDRELEAEQECALNLSLNIHKSDRFARSQFNDQPSERNHLTNVTHQTDNSRSNSNGSASSSSSSSSGWSSAADSLTSRSPDQQLTTSAPPPSISSPISASQAISLLQNAARQHYYYQQQYNTTLKQLTQQQTPLLEQPQNTTDILSSNTSNLLTRQQQAQLTSALATNATNQYQHLFQAQQQQQQQQLTNNAPANNRLLFLHHQNHHTHQQQNNHHHNHHELGSVHKADSDDLDRIRNFIEQFKARRGALGLTQKQAAQCFRAYTHDRYAFSDNFVGHFEGFQFRPQTAMTIADSLADWLEFAENETRQGRQLSFMPGKVKETRKRKYEVIRIRDSAKRILVEAFEKNKSPSTSELEQLSRKTNIPSRNIEIFFKNRRTSRQYHQ